MLGKILVCFHFLLLEYGIYFTFHGEKLSGCILLAIITFGISFLGEMFKKRFGFLVVGAFAEILVLLLTGNVVELIMFTFFTVVLSVAYTIQSASEKGSSLATISLGWLLFLLGCYIPLYFTKYPGQQSLQILGVCYVVVYLLHLSNDNMNDFKKIHSRLEKLPLVQLGKTFFLSVSGVVLWTVFGMLMGRNERLAAYLSSKLQEFLNKLGGTAIKIAPDGMQGGMTDIVKNYMGDPYEPVQTLPEHTYVRNYVLEYILKIVLCILAMFLVLFLLYSLYCYLKRDRKDEGDVVEFIKKEDKEVVSLKKRQFKVRGSRQEQSPNAIVRKMYKKKIKSGIKERIPEWASPYELETLAEWQEKGSESMLHKLYEKARYSKNGCEKEDLDRYKSVDENYH
jgi:hypothetical protein